MQSSVLLLGSEPVARLVMQEVREQAGYVMATGDLGTAVDRVGECKPDLLIVSPYVETITGHEAAKYLQSRCPSMQILMVAGPPGRRSSPIPRRGGKYGDFPETIHRSGAAGESEGSAQRVSNHQPARLLLLLLASKESLN
jgi:hypothetical protein